MIRKTVRVRVALLFVDLAIPIDVVPDFIPILGYADDAIVVVLILRSVCRRVSVEELREARPGTDDGFAALYQLVRPVTPRPRNHAANGTHAFRVGSITSCSRAPAGTFAHNLSSSTVAVRNRWFDHQPASGIGQRRDMCCTAGQVDTQCKVLLVHEPSSSSTTDETVHALDRPTPTSR
jgi:uncharacterized membrane protein YkvA (DUF1232 family)